MSEAQQEPTMTELGQKIDKCIANYATIVVKAGAERAPIIAELQGLWTEFKTRHAEAEDEARDKIRELLVTNGRFSDLYEEWSARAIKAERLIEESLAADLREVEDENKELRAQLGEESHE